MATFGHEGGGWMNDDQRSAVENRPARILHGDAAGEDDVGSDDPAAKPSLGGKCPQCDRVNSIVNECGCDPNNMPTKAVDPAPTGLCDDRRELWYCCTGIVNSHETGDDLKQMALGIRQQLRLEARVNELTKLFYSVKEQRDRFLAFCRVVCPENPNSSAVWDHEVGNMFKELLSKDRQRLRDLLDECEKFCPVWMQDKIRASRKNTPPAHLSRLLEALKAIADPEHCLTKNTVQGLRDVALAALQEVDPKNDYSSCTGPGDDREPEQLEGWDCRAGFAPKQ